jgi:hypothetical protein
LPLREAVDPESPTQAPILACCNFINNSGDLREFALGHGFGGVDWTFTLETLPEGHSAEGDLAKELASLRPLELRYHCAFKRTELGAEDPEEALQAMQVPPRTLADLKDRLEMVSRLPLCNWWVLELREEKSLLMTLGVVRKFLSLQQHERKGT